MSLAEIGWTMTRRFILAALIVAGSGAVAGAQTDSATPPPLRAPPTVDAARVMSLTQLDPWGVGWISSGDGALASTLWQATDADSLAPVLAAVDPERLSPAMADLVRRVMLSSGRAPDGAAADLIPERLRLLSGLGETARAQTLALRFPQIAGDRASWVNRADRLLFRGELGRACADADGQLQTEPPPQPVPGSARIVADDPATDLPASPEPLISAPPPPSESEVFARKLRALCYVAANEPDAAQVSIDLLRAQDIQDPWFFTAILSATGLGGESRPIGDFSTGLRAATSIAAELRPAANALDLIPVGALELLMDNPSLPAGLRVDAATRAAETGAISPLDHRAFLRQFLADPSLRSPALDYLRALGEAEASGQSPAAVVRTFLQSATGSARSFRRAARFAQADIEALAPVAADASDAVWFARASAANGELGLAALWRAAAEVEHSGAQESGAQEPGGSALVADATAETRVAAPKLASPAALAALDGLLLVAGLAPDGGVSQQTSTTAIAMASLLGAPISAADRVRLAAVSDARGRNVPGGLLMRLTAAAATGAQGEAALLAAQAAGPNPETLATRDLVAVMLALREAGLIDDARALALDVMLAQRPPG